MRNQWTRALIDYHIVLQVNRLTKCASHPKVTEVFYLLELKHHGSYYSQYLEGSNNISFSYLKPELFLIYSLDFHLISADLKLFFPLRIVCLYFLPSRFQIFFQVILGDL